MGQQKDSSLLPLGNQAHRVKMQHLDTEASIEAEGSMENIGTRDRDTENITKNLDEKSEKATSNILRRAGRCGKDKTKRTKENESKRMEQLKQSSNMVKPEGKPTVHKNKKIRHAPELSNDTFKKPQTQLAMHMLESLQVFHPLGKKAEQKHGISSSRIPGDLRKNDHGYNSIYIHYP